MVSTRSLDGERDDLDLTEDRNRVRNQALIREVNEQVCAFAAASASEQEVLVICECTAVGCSAPLRLTCAEYDRIRQSSTHFIVKLGHVHPEGEHVVEQTPQFVVVEKLGEGAAIAIHLDPRREH